MKVDLINVASLPSLIYAVITTNLTNLTKLTNLSNDPVGESAEQRDVLGLEDIYGRRCSLA